MKQKFLKAMLLSLLIGSISAWSQQKPNNKVPVAPQRDGKVDISDLENKYWAPKDTDFSVVQNRTYTKTKRVSLSLMPALLLRDSYSEGVGLNATLNYYFSERSGVELSYLKITPENSDTISGFDNQYGGLIPDHGKIDSLIDLGYNYVPFYAKVSVLGKRIIYFDMMFTPTVGMVGYDIQLRSGNESESTFSYGFDISQHFFLSERWTVRMDIKNRWYNEDRKVWNTGVSTGSIFKNTTFFNLGVQFFF